MVSRASSLSDKHRAPLPGSGNKLCCQSSVRGDVADIQVVFTAFEIRMVRGSLLIIYEADWARAEDGFQQLWLDEGKEEHEEEDDDEDDRPGPRFVVKIIDFTHTRMALGEGPDEGVLLGFDATVGC
jgi:1D-myo-inositol-tetrakisphosphate 5-kinase/inositol-polyphosphate multikinase